MAQFNKPQPLNFKGNLCENWKKFEQQFKIYMEAADFNTGNDARKIAIFLNVVGEEAIDVYNTISINEEDKKDLDKVLDAFKKYCNPRKNLLFQRYLFNNRCQNEGEPIDHYLTELKKMVTDCEFGAQEKSILRDRIVMGLYDKQLQEKIIKLKDEDVEYEKTIEYCRIAEATQTQLKAFKGQNINAITKPTTSGPQGRNQENNKDRNFQYCRPNQVNNGNSRNENNENRNQFVCARCKRNHAIKQCPAYNKNCHACGIRGHFAYACRKKKFVKQVNESMPDLNDLYLASILRTDNINEINNKWVEKIKINNVVVEFKLDKGG